MKRILAFASLILFGTLAFAQTGISTGAGSTADAVHYRGAWTAGTTEYINIDLKDSTADTNGYVNSLYLGGLGRIYPTAGFDTYAGYAEYVPTKTLASLIKSTNIPADSFRVYVRGGLGETIPDNGNSFVTGFAGAGVDYAITSSGSVVWNTVYAEWQNPGVVVVKSGLQVYLGGSSTATVQSAKAAKERRLFGLKRAHLTANDYYEAAKLAR